DIRPRLIKRLADHLDGLWPECGVLDQRAGFHGGLTIRTFCNLTVTPGGALSRENNRINPSAWVEDKQVNYCLADSVLATRKRSRDVPASHRCGLRSA